MGLCQLLYARARPVVIFTRAGAVAEGDNHDPEDFGMVFKFHPGGEDPGAQHPAKDALFGHDAVADFLVDGATCAMALLPDLGDLQLDIPAGKPVEGMCCPDFHPGRGDVFGEFAG